MLAAALATVLLDVPFVPQQKDTCGAAALAMVLRYWGQPADQAEIAAALLRPELQGIQGSELAAFARARGMLAVAYEGDLAQLRDYVTKGRPVIVAWKMARDRYHDVVVVGFDEARRELVVHDPDLGAARRIAEKTFERQWAGAGHWALLVLPKEG
jgi:ABC-type bacteriocin/lantibiotic exporter with double-glycine peptidase domain